MRSKITSFCSLKVAEEFGVTPVTVKNKEVGDPESRYQQELGNEPLPSSSLPL